ncbi:MAG: hypothetical protein EOO15_20940 [Chitinophagaceae bacterium]|nr:MAG: hypothetical protein EOO15_20940 [Chitinophagaceae bacterium]
MIQSTNDNSFFLTTKKGLPAARNRIRVLLTLLLFSFFSTNLAAQIQLTYCDGNPEDWANFTTAYPIHAYSLDVANAASNADNQFTGGSKDGSAISAWRWSVGNANAKGDITNAGAVLTGTNNCVLRFFGDRTSDNGDASIGFWFFVNPVSPNTNGTFASSHSNGDILIISDFTSGGTKPTIKVYEWMNGGLVLQTASTARCADVNHVTRPVPAGFSYTASNGATSYAPNLFFEGAVDLCALNLSTCFTSFLVETRNSQSITASLQDFTSGSFNASPARPSATVDQPTCTEATGTVNVTSPVSGYTYKLIGPSPATDTASSTSGVFNTVAPGTYSLIAVQGSCSSPARSVVVDGSPETPDRPVVTLREATICDTVTAPRIIVSCPVEGTTYTLTQPGVTGSQEITYSGSGDLIFTVVPGKGFSITATVGECISDATTCDNYTSNSCPSTNRRKTVQENREVAPTTVVAAPNPFSDRIRFTLQPTATGQGSLELYNVLGQKVKTIFQGHVEKGQARYIEYNVPFGKRADLIYVFILGNQKVTGKLVNVQ